MRWRSSTSIFAVCRTSSTKRSPRRSGVPSRPCRPRSTTSVRSIPAPDCSYNKVQARLIEPDVAFVKHGDEWLVIMNDEDLPQLRLNPAYKKLVTRDGTNEKSTRDYVKERYKSAIQLIKNIEQRKQTITKVCYSIVARQQEFLEKRHRSTETDDDQGGGRRNRRASFDGKPCRGQQICPHTAGRIRVAIFLQRERAGARGWRHIAADPQAPRQESSSKKKIPAAR